ncbi:hypothetical protein IJ541_08945 [bacterium]|nr:hypothetical protein [bacterium]MBQ9246007.1 hypothetical protein [bacterium]MBQ9246890.1 hypothetical protein [bacterium]
MKISTFDKIIISIVCLLVICAGIAIYKTYFNKNSYYIQMRNMMELAPATATHKEFPADIKKFSKKYHALEELFLSDKKVFTYGYKPLSIEKNMDERFSQHLLARISENNLDNYEVIPYENWEKLRDKIKIENFPGLESEACTMVLPEEKDLDSVLQVADECVMNSCIIDAPNNEYFVLTRNIDFIVQTLKEQDNFRK